MENTSSSGKVLLPADTVLGRLNVLAPHEKKAINQFLKLSSPQIEDCRRQRVRLLESRTNLKTSFVCWQLAFEKACPEYHQKNPTEWRDFDKEVRSHHSSVDKQMRCILSISEAWGDDVVQHYAWQSSPIYNCNKLRIRSTDKRTTEVKEKADPVERSDLEYACGHKFPSDKHVESLDLSQLPEGYGLDLYGLIVRKRFAAQTPSSPSQQHRTTLHAGDSGSPTLSPQSKRATEPAGLTSPSPTPPASPEHHQVSGDNENSGDHDSDDRNGSSAVSTSRPSILAPVLSSYGATALSSSEATELSSSEARTLQTSLVPSDSTALSRDTEQSDPSAIYLPDSKLENKKRKEPHDAYDELFECGARAQERFPIAQGPLSTRVTDNNSQPPTPRPSPLQRSIDLPGTPSTPIHPDLPINQVPHTAEDDSEDGSSPKCDPTWGSLFEIQNFGDMKAGLLDECFHQDHSKMLIDDIPKLREEGYVHWKDEIIGASIGLMDQDSFWTSDGWGILNSTVTNPRIRKILRDWFSGQQCNIVHWLWWGVVSTQYAPIYLARADAESLANDRFDFPYLGLHISCPTADIKYYAKSHREIWPFQKSAWFRNSVEALQGHTLSEGLSNGFTVFDPRINFRFDKGSAATIIFGPRDSGRMRKLPVKDPEINATFEKMEADGVGFNFEFVGE
ncbi:uncharacterized protein LA080_007203 [Diaporthe eres]|nr:uncharacterized protein LA080_007203 [Diaporthe eres]